MFRVERATESCARRWCVHMGLNVSHPQEPRRRRTTWPRTSVLPCRGFPPRGPTLLESRAARLTRSRGSKRTPGEDPFPSLRPTTAGSTSTRSVHLPAQLSGLTTRDGQRSREACRDERRCGWRLTPARGFPRGDVHQGHASDDGRRGTPSDFANHGEFVSSPPSVPEAGRSTWVRSARRRIDEVLRPVASPEAPRPLRATRIARRHAVTSMPQPRCHDFPSGTGTG